MSATPKPTPEQLEELRREVEMDSPCVWDLPGMRALLLAAYEATQRPIVAEPEYPAPLDVAALPAFWHARRARAGKGPSLCAEELERALAAHDGRWAKLERLAVEVLAVNTDVDAHEVKP